LNGARRRRGEVKLPAKEVTSVGFRATTAYIPRVVSLVSSPKLRVRDRPTCDKSAARSHQTPLSKLPASC
jgi:hypothetical protein